MCISAIVKIQSRQKSKMTAILDFDLSVLNFVVQALILQKELRSSDRKYEVPSKGRPARLPRDNKTMSLKWGEHTFCQILWHLSGTLHRENRRMAAVSLYSVLMP